MCLSAPKPKIVKAPAPMPLPPAPNKAGESTKKPQSMVGKGKDKRRRGTARQSLVVKQDSRPTGVNTNKGGVGVYS